MARFIRRGVSKFYFLPAVVGYDPAAGTGAPTRVEITAGTDLSPSIAGISGFQLTNQSVATPDMGSDFDSNIPGTDTAEASSLTLYEDDTATTLETLLGKGEAGFIYIMRKGDKPSTTTADLHPVRVSNRSAEISADNAPARFVVNFAITSKPALDTAIPA